MQHPLSIFKTSILCLTFFLPSIALAAPQAAITIEQVSPKALGSWHLIYGDGDSLSSLDKDVNPKKYVFSLTEFQPMTLSASAPAGMNTVLTIMRNGDVVPTGTSPQFSFTPRPNDSYRFLIRYEMAPTGSLGITAEPSKVRFRIIGPTRRVISGSTPKTIPNLPAGQYSLTFSAVNGCASPAPKSVIISAGVRETVHATLACGSEEKTSIIPRKFSKRSIVEEAIQREQKPIGQRR